jgi:hypothetical protein
MGISRPTFGRLVTEARRKVADALFHGHVLAFGGGPFALAPGPWYRCGGCGQEWRAPDPDRSASQPCGACGSQDVAAAPPVPNPNTLGPGGGGRGRGGQRRRQGQGPGGDQGGRSRGPGGGPRRDRSS